jgi:hypothetical protein
MGDVVQDKKRDSFEKEERKKNTYDGSAKKKVNTSVVCNVVIWEGESRGRKITEALSKI